MAVKDLSTALEVPPVHPLHGTAPGPLRDRLPDQRLQYDATLAQLRMQQELERRGKQKPLRCTRFHKIKGGTP